MLSVKEVSSTILKVFGMTQPEIEPRSPGPLANTLPTWLMSGVMLKYAANVSSRPDCIFEI